MEDVYDNSLLIINYKIPGELLPIIPTVNHCISTPWWQNKYLLFIIIKCKRLQFLKCWSQPMSSQKTGKKLKTWDNFNLWKIHPRWMSVDPGTFLWLFEDSPAVLIHDTVNYWLKTLARGHGNSITTIKCPVHSTQSLFHYASLCPGNWV